MSVESPGSGCILLLRPRDQRAVGRAGERQAGLGGGPLKGGWHSRLGIPFPCCLMEHQQRLRQPETVCQARGAAEPGSASAGRGSWSMPWFAASGLAGVGGIGKRVFDETGQAKASLRGKRRRQALLGHLHQRECGVVRVAAQPAAPASFPHGTKHLADKQGFKFGGGGADALRR